MALKLYGVAPSQPTRAIMFLCAIKKYPYKMMKTSPADHTASKQKYIDSVNPTGKIPGISITDNNNKEFMLYESSAIMTYLCSLNNWNDLYPSANDNLHRRALIDQYLYWHQDYTRSITCGFFRPLLQSTFRNIDYWDPNVLAKERMTAMDTLRIIETNMLSKHQYIVDDALSIADIQCYEEIVQLKQWNFILNKEKIDTERDHPNIHKWLEKVQSIDGHDESHRVLGVLTPWMQERFKEYGSLYAEIDALM